MFARHLTRCFASSSARYVLAIDQGTTSSRAVLFDSECKIVDLHQKEHKQITPAPGWVEHNPEEIVSSVKECISKLLSRAEQKHKITASQIACVGVTNQRETTVAWSKRTGKPLHNAIVWLDSRTFDLANKMIASHGNDLNYFKPTCGLPIHSYFSALKMRWLLDHSPEVARAAREDDLCFGNIDSWLIYVRHTLFTHHE